MTLPKRTGLSEALRFVESSREWIVRTLSKQTPMASVADGAAILYRGESHRLQFIGGKRGVVSASEGMLLVPGDVEHAPRRLRDYLKSQALKQLSAASHKYAQMMDTRYSRISIRDQKSRWGSCSASGVLSYSWRLILAPDFVLDYVAAHEVAHLCEMNHGPRFWRLVLAHCAHARDAKQWLKAHGKDVHCYF